MAALCGETSLLYLQCILPCDVSVNKRVTNGDAAANANVCVGDRDLAYEPRSKRCIYNSFHHSFIPGTTRTWNILPEHNVCSSTLVSFSDSLKC